MVNIKLKKSKKENNKGKNKEKAKKKEKVKDNTHKLPKLYQKNAIGNIYEWEIYVIRKEDDTVWTITTYGTVGGKMITKEKEIKSGKKKGTKAETTKFEQGILDITSKWKHKFDKEGYVKSIKDAEKHIFISPMLASKFTYESLSKKRGTNIKLPAYIQPKYDGWRCLANMNKINNGDKDEDRDKDGDEDKDDEDNDDEQKEEIILNSRSNTRYSNQSFKHIVNDLIGVFNDKNAPKRLYIDGELYTDKVPFEELGLMKKTLDKDVMEKFKLVSLYVFDCIDLDNLEMPFEERLKLLKKLIGKKYSNLVLVPTKLVSTVSEIKENFQIYTHEGGYEGLIIRNRHSPYEIDKRSKHLQKLKEMNDDEFKIIGYKEGTGTDRGTVIWRCVTKDGNEFDVRPKGTVAHRKKLFKDAETYIGRDLTVTYFGYTKYGVPRMPVGKAIREDK